MLEAISISDDLLARYIEEEVAISAVTGDGFKLSPQLKIVWAVFVPIWIPRASDGYNTAKCRLKI
jgi:hypothetical protein